MMRWAPLLLALLLPGCGTLNETMVRQMYKDHGISRKTRNQIRQGLEQREQQPQEVPKQPAPAFLDQG